GAMSAAAPPETRTITDDPAPAMARDTVRWMLTRNKLGAGVQLGALIGAVVVAVLAFLTDFWWLGALLLGLLVVSGLLAAFSYVLVLRSVRLSYPVGSAAGVAFAGERLVSVSAVGSQSLSADAFLRVVVQPST